MSFLLGLGKHLTPSSIIRGQQSRRRKEEKREKKVRKQEKEKKDDDEIKRLKKMGVVNTLKFLLRHLDDLFYMRARYHSAQLLGLDNSGKNDYWIMSNNWNEQGTIVNSQHGLSVNQRNELVAQWFDRSRQNPHIGNKAIKDFLKNYTHIETDKLIQITHLIYLIDFKVFPGILNSNELIKSYRQKDPSFVPIFSVAESSPTTVEVFNVLSDVKWGDHTSEFMRFIEQTIEKIKKENINKIISNQLVPQKINLDKYTNEGISNIISGMTAGKKKKKKKKKKTVKKRNMKIKTKKKSRVKFGQHL